jgi:hypothetical protein
MPLQCDKAQPPKVDAILERMRKARVVMMGEYHGSEQIRDFSAGLFAEAVNTQKISRLGLEVQMDVSEAIETYLSTGSGPILSTYQYDLWTRNSFWALVEKAKALRAQGRDVRAYGIDVPANLGWVHEKLTEQANALTDPALKALLLDTLPEKFAYRATDTRVPAAYAQKVNAYYTAVTAKRAELCQAAPASCERMLQLASAFDLGAINQSQGAKTGDYFTRREALMAFNMTGVLANEARAYVHVGLYHSARSGGQTLGAELARTYASTGGVYSILAAFGSGSEVFYNGRTNAVEASPDGLSPILEATGNAMFFIPTIEPSPSCVSNPFVKKDFVLPNSSLKTRYGTGFDGFVWFRRLTASL